MAHWALVLQVIAIHSIITARIDALQRIVVVGVANPARIDAGQRPGRHRVADVKAARFDLAEVYVLAFAGLVAVMQRRKERVGPHDSGRTDRRRWCR